MAKRVAQLSLVRAAAHRVAGAEWTIRRVVHGGSVCISRWVYGGNVDRSPPTGGPSRRSGLQPLVEVIARTTIRGSAPK